MSRSLDSRVLAAKRRRLALNAGSTAESETAACQRRAPPADLEADSRLGGPGCCRPGGEFQSFPADSNNGRRRCLARREKSMEIGVERHASSFLLPRVLENPQVFSTAQPDVADMSDIPAGGREQSGRGTGQALIQQEANQAVSNGMILSSRLLAANSSACRMSSGSSSGYSARKCHLKEARGNRHTEHERKTTLARGQQ